MPSEPTNPAAAESADEQHAAAGFDAFDAIPAHIAVLDSTGQVLHVNTAWRAFATANAMLSAGAGVGDNYLAICQRAGGDFAEEAPIVARGLRAVLAGEMPQFVLDYPCHSPSEARWFRMSITPLLEAGRRGAVVMHMNVTGPEEDALTRRAAESMAQESDRRLRFALDAARIGEWSLDLRTNDAHRSLLHDQCFGYTQLLPTWSYDTFLAHVVPEDRSHVDAGFQAAMAGKGEYDDEFRTRWSDGSLHWLWTRGRFYFGPDGKPIRVAGIVMDISDGKRSERDIARALDRLTAAQGIGRIGDWKWDANTNHISWSAQVFELMGRDPALGPPKDLGEFEAYFDADNVERLRAGISAAFSTRAKQEYELTLTRSDGARVELQAVALPVLNHAGDVTGLDGTVQDITERKRAEAVSDRLASIVASSGDAIIGMDLHGRITNWNSGAQNTFGYSEFEMLGSSIARLVPDEGQAEAELLLERIRSGQSMERLETVRRRKDGALIDVAMTVSPIRNAKGQIVGISKVSRDISERRKLEQQFLRAQRMESIGTLAGGIAHDLNNVLTPIMLSLEILRESFPDPTSQSLIGSIERSAEHGAAMVKQVLSFARGVGGQRLSVEVRPLVVDIANIAGDTFHKNIEVVTSAPDNLWTVVGDQTQLHQVVLNLCVNARDAMPQGGTLTLTAENVVLDDQYAGLSPDVAAGPYVCIRVVDTGTGMTASTIAQIFDPFFTTKEVGRGTGLGLSTSEAIIKSHGGFIRVYSELGRGSTFSIYLPAQTAQASVVSKPAVTLPRGNGELILVVDDEPSVRHVTQQTLEAFGYRVVTAGDGSEALAVYARQSREIAAVITDMTMPVMDGASTIRVLRKMDPRLRIIAASGLDVKAQVVGLGVEHTLSKPYAADTLLNLLRVVLRQQVSM